jgi:L-2,4-diaminobutyric acid acetyltransferase
MFTCRQFTEADAELALNLARGCPPLDVHTPYTYWVVSRYYGETCYFLEEDGLPIGYLLAVPKGRTLFLWQLGILESHRGKGSTTLLFDALALSVEGMFDAFELTISPDNAASYGALASWCRSHQLRIERLNSIVVPEHEEPGEILYRIVL